MTNQEKDQVIIMGLNFLGEIRKTKTRFSQEVFEAYCAAMITCPIEIVPYTQEGKILIIRRDATDKFFANLWHTPGTVQLPNETLGEAMKRVIDVELAGLKLISEPQFVGVVEVLKGPLLENKNPRSQERSVVYVIKVKGEEYPPDSKQTFAPINNLPEDTISYHKNILMPKIIDFLANTTV